MIQIYKTNIAKRYETLPTMISEALGEECTYENVDGPLWHYNSFIESDRLIRPDHDVVERWNSKFYQYEKLSGIVRLPDYKIYHNALSLLTDRRFWEYIVTSEYGEGGHSSMFCDPSTDASVVYKRYDGEVRASEYIPNAESFSVHCIIFNETDVYVSPIVKQHIKRRVLFTGGKYPYETPDGLHEMCKEICKVLYNDGYIGMVHIDYLLADDKIYFCEINPRMAVTTPYVAYSLEQEYGINLPYLEYIAITEGRMPEINTIKQNSTNWDVKLFYGTMPENLITHHEMRHNITKAGIYYLDMFDGRYAKVEIND